MQKTWIVGEKTTKKKVRKNWKKKIEKKIKKKEKIKKKKQKCPWKHMKIIIQVRKIKKNEGCNFY